MFSLRNLMFSSAAQSCLSLQPDGLQHTRPLCPSPTPRLYSNSCPLSRWCQPTILSSPLLLLPSIFPSIRVFSNELALCIRWPKYWSFSFNISSSNENLGLISFRMDWLDLLAIQGTLKSLLQHHSSKTSILQCLAFFTIPRREYRSGLPFPPPGDLPNPGIEPASPAFPAMAGRFCTTEPPGKPTYTHPNTKKLFLWVPKNDIKIESSTPDPGGPGFIPG